MNLKKKILAFKIEAYDYYPFYNQVIEFFPDSVIIRFNPHSNAKIMYNKKDIADGREFNFTTVYIKGKAYYFFYPIIFFIDFFKIFFLLNSIKNLDKYDYFFTDNTYACVAFKLLSLRKKIKVVYASHDWLAGTIGKGIWSRIGKNLIFVMCDYISCKNTYKVLNHTSAVQQLRNQYWKNNSFNQYLYQPKIFEKFVHKKNNHIKKNLLFLGLVRQESGIPKIIKLIKENNILNNDIQLKIVGVLDDGIKNIISNKDFNRYVLNQGFGNRNNFQDLFSDCFCGLCLVTDNNSYTSNTIPSKLIDYIQYNLPIIATRNLGYTSDIIKKYSLGILVNNNLEDLTQAIDLVRKNQNKYQDNIKKYLKDYQYTKITEIFK